METASLLCIARNELPFTDEWLEYHFALGFDRVRYVSTDDDFGEVEAFMKLSPFRDRVDLAHFADFTHGWQIRSYNEHRRHIEDDWIMVLDLDEFVHLPSDWPTIKDFLATVPADVGQVQFPWLNAVSSAYLHRRTLDLIDTADTYASVCVKSIVRRRAIGGLGVHSHRVGAATTRLSSGLVVEPAAVQRLLLDDTTHASHAPCVLHAAARGHLDQIMRVVGHRFFNHKAGPREQRRLVEFLTGAPTASNIPSRVLQCLSHTSMPRVVLESTARPDVSSATELDELRRLVARELGHHLELGELGHEPIERIIEDRFGYDAKVRAVRAALGPRDGAPFPARLPTKDPELRALVAEAEKTRPLGV